MYHQYREGYIEVICGCMFAGKTEELIRRINVCAKCGSPATRTQRLVDGKPASFDDPVVLVGAVDHYEPRCRHCHEVVNKPIKIKRKAKSSQ